MILQKKSAQASSPLHPTPPLQLHLGKEVDRRCIDKGVVRLGRQQVGGKLVNVADRAKKASMARNATKGVGVLVRDLQPKRRGENGHR